MNKIKEDLKKYNGFAISKDGEHIEFSKIRVGLNDGEYFFSEDWSDVKNNEPIIIELDTYERGY